MAEGTRYFLGPVELDLCEFSWPFSLGATSPAVVIRQSIDKADELEALPRITELRIECAAEDNTPNPSLGSYPFAGLRVAEVRRVNGVVCEVHLRDARDDIARKVCPADFLMRWKDGFLDGTNLPTLQLAVEYLAQLVPELDAILAADAFSDVAGRDELPNDLPGAGAMLPEVLESLANLVGASLCCKPNDGGLFFARLASIAANPLDVNAYNWAGGFLPSWLTANRQLRGLPRFIRVYYREKHAIRLVGGVDTETSTMDPALRMDLVQVYSVGDKFLTLAELLVEYGLESNAITDAQIAKVKNTENFDGTALEPVGGFDTEAKELIRIIKADHWTLWRIRFPENSGRMGGWKNPQFGYFKQTTDKDGNLYHAGDITGRGVRCEWTEWLALAEDTSGSEQGTLLGAVVARSRVRGGGGSPLPDAPFVASWVSEKDGVLRVSPGNLPGSAQVVWLGKMAAGKELRVTDGGLPTDDQGVTTGTTGGLKFPTVADVEFASTFKIEVFMVAERQLPNTAAKWKKYDVAAFADGEVEAHEVEVGDELYVLRDYVDPNGGKHADSDGLGFQLENREPEEDAARRAAVVIDRLQTALGGSGTAIGAEAAFDLIPGFGITSITLDVDGVAVQTVIEAGSYDSEDSRQRRAARRAAGRVVESGGKVAAI